MKNITTFILTVLFSFSMLANISISEKDALVKLYHSTNGNQWKVKWEGLSKMP